MGSVLARQVAALEISRERLEIRVERLEAAEADAPPLFSVTPIMGAGATVRFLRLGRGVVDDLV